jgi:hypothetical protein
MPMVCAMSCIRHAQENITNHAHATDKARIGSKALGVDVLAVLGACVVNTRLWGTGNKHPSQQLGTGLMKKMVRSGGTYTCCGLVISSASIYARGLQAALARDTTVRTANEDVSGLGPFQESGH